MDWTTEEAQEEQGVDSGIEFHSNTALQAT